MKTLLAILAMILCVGIMLAGFFVIVGFLSAYGLLADEDTNSYIDEEFDK